MFSKSYIKEKLPNGMTLESLTKTHDENLSKEYKKKLKIQPFAISVYLCDENYEKSVLKLKDFYHKNNIIEENFVLKSKEKFTLILQNNEFKSC